MKRAATAVSHSRSVKQTTLQDYATQIKPARSSPSSKPSVNAAASDTPCFFYDAASVAAFKEEPLELMKKLVTNNAKYARASHSNFHVAAAILGQSGCIYIGVNLEFPGVGLETACHAEEAAVAMAVLHGETGLQALVVNAPPCGFCRQMLAETASADSLMIHVIQKDKLDFSLSLNELLPMKFGPSDLGLSPSLLAKDRTPHPLLLVDEDDTDDVLLQKALVAASHSYCPYTDCAAGVALETTSGAIYTGSYVENCAYNPSIPPWKSALVALTAGGEPFDEIKRACLVEVDCQVSHFSSLQSVIGAMQPNARASVHKVTHASTSCGGALQGGHK